MPAKLPKPFRRKSVRTAPTKEHFTVDELIADFRSETKERIDGLERRVETLEQKVRRLEERHHPDDR